MSAPRKIRLADLSPDPIIVELGDKTYEVVPVTRSVQQKLSKALRALNAAESDADAEPDKALAALADCLDAVLSPQGEAPAVKSVIVAAWKADELSLAQVSGLFESIHEAATSRPT